MDKIKKILKLLYPFLLIIIVLNSGYFIRENIHRLLFNIIYLIAAILIFILQLQNDKLTYANKKLIFGLIIIGVMITLSSYI